MSQAKATLIQAQRDTLRRLTDNSFYVPVTFSEAIDDEEASSQVTLHIQCREMPMETLLESISDLIYRLGDHAITTSGEIISQKLTQFADAKEKEKQDEALAQLFGALIPTLLSILPHAPEIVSKILLDCIIGATPDDVKRLGVSPSLAILQGVIARLESKEVKEQFIRFFATLWSKFGRKAGHSVEVV